MTTLAAPSQPTSTAVTGDDRPGDGPILLAGVSWRTYESLLADIERSGQHLYLTYDRGRLEIMPPSPFHERYKKLIDRLIDAINFEWEVPICALGSTTFRREDLSRGLEPDECYYVQHEAEMGAKERIDLSTDPPPDLAIEMDHSHHAIDRDDIYAALGVPEIWLFDGTRLRGFRRTADAAYAPITDSVAFPRLKLADLERFLVMGAAASQESAVRAFRQFLRDNRPTA
jgi:Uma2 family endonuclease